ncbi:hypothetical protein NP493_140g01015 [Ridgeia piscesae]|uniref:PHD-type domain-containing protein n=1 Tax=Ridgeia piscesae TaxID=27915 RepID=A0AAD9P4Y2_RIDPI|nr:hypothetical protein NP493_140g01015 [Ridgeia piscesae]
MATPDNTIIVNRSLFEQVLESLCSPDGEGEGRHEERQQALIELIKAGGLKHFSEDKLIELVEKAKFFKICERLYWKRRQYEKIMSCYLRDTVREGIVFHFVEHVLLGEKLSEIEKEKVRNEVITNIHTLVTISSSKTAQLLLSCFCDCLRVIVKKLEPEPELLYKLLRAIFECREDEGGATEHTDIVADVHELYVELMCKVDADKVAGYIIRTEGYRIEETLEICRRYDVSEATAFLLEKLGAIQEAFDVLLEKLKTSIGEFCEKCSPTHKKAVDYEGGVAVWQTIEGVISTMIHLCQRNSPKMEEANSEALWFPLLDTVLASQRKVDQSHAEAFKTLTTQVLNGMMGYVALPAVLQRIMQDPGYCSGRFGEIRELVLGMFDTYNYEKTLLHTCCNLLNHDVHRQLVSLTQTARHAIVPRRDTCQLCRKPLHVGLSDNVICFRCGHMYHEACLESPGCCERVDGEQQWTCYKCSSRGRGSASARQRVHRSISSSSQPLSPPTISRVDMADASLEDNHIQAVDNIRRAQKTKSRFAILTELSRRKRSSTGRSNLLQNERFQLRLAPPLPFEND